MRTSGLFKIGEMSKIFHISVSSLRHYCLLYTSRSAAISETSLQSPAESPARKAAPKAVVSTILGLSLIHI